MVSKTLSTGLSALAGLILAVTPAIAHHPDRESHPVRRRVDVIPPLGNNLPLSYAAKYNRPSYLTGRISYWIAPTSLEAMSWHRAAHLGYYANHAPRMVTHYIFPKPWEALGVGPKSELSAQVSGDAAPAPTIYKHGADAPLIEPLEEPELAPPVELLPVPRIPL